MSSELGGVGVSLVLGRNSAIGVYLVLCNAVANLQHRNPILSDANVQHLLCDLPLTQSEAWEKQGKPSSRC
jgi:hypothetical protein